MTTACSFTRRSNVPPPGGRRPARRHPSDNPRARARLKTAHQPIEEKVMAFEAMFQPIQIGKPPTRNRVLSTAHAEVYATDGGMTTERYVKYYEEKAKGGIGLAICGGSSVVAIDSPQHWWSSVNLSTDRIIPHFPRIWPTPCTSTAPRS